MTNPLAGWNPETDPTPALTDYVPAHEADSNLWWRIPSGHRLNLFEAAVEQLEEARARIAAALALHRPIGSETCEGLWCAHDACAFPWPCDTYKTLTEDAG